MSSELELESIVNDKKTLSIFCGILLVMMTPVNAICECEETIRLLSSSSIDRSGALCLEFEIP
jgi:hypothetical protein